MKTAPALAFALVLSVVTIHANAEPGSEQALNDGMFDNHATYGHILADSQRDIVHDKESTADTDISVFEPESRVSKGRIDDSLFDNRETYGHILSN